MENSKNIEKKNNHFDISPINQNCLSILSLNFFYNFYQKSTVYNEKFQKVFFFYSHIQRFSHRQELESRVRRSGSANIQWTKKLTCLIQIELKNHWFEGPDFDTPNSPIMVPVPPIHVPVPVSENGIFGPQ